MRTTAIILVTLLCAETVHADPGVADQVTRVADAAMARLEMLGLPVNELRITPVEGGAVVDVDGRRRFVAITDWDDPDATCLLVLNAVDLAQDVELAVLPSVVARPLLPPSIERPPLPVADPPPGPAPAVGAAPAPRRQWLIAATRLGRGLDDTDPWMIGGSAELATERSRLRLAAGVGWTRGMRHREGSPEEAVYDAWPVSVSLGVELASVELVARGAVAPYALRGVEATTGVAFGAGVGLRHRHHVAGDASVVVELGADAWARRVALVALDRTVYTSPRIAPYAAIGLAWSLRP